MIEFREMKTFKDLYVWSLENPIYAIFLFLWSLSTPIGIVIVFKTTWPEEITSNVGYLSGTVIAYILFYSFAYALIKTCLQIPIWNKKFAIKKD